MEWVFWAMAAAALLHVVEEYAFGWLDFTRGLRGRLASRSAAGIDLIAFVVVNALFVALCVAGALVGMERPFFSLSIAALLLINAVMHLLPMLAVRRYSPGAVTALLLYVPLSIYAFHVVDRAGELDALTVIGAFLLGLLWLSFPIAASLIRSARRGG